MVVVNLRCFLDVCPMGDEYAVVALGHLLLPLMQALHKMVSDSS